MIESGVRPRLLMISNDVIGTRMAGPGIRCWELARVLSSVCDVTLASPDTADCRHPNVRTVAAAADSPDLRPYIDDADVVLLDAWLLERIGGLPPHQIVIADMYDPFVLENLELFREEPLVARTAQVNHNRRIVEKLLCRADFAICANERQRDFWLGQLTMLGRVNPQTYDDDRSLKRLIALVPFGLPSEPPRADGPFARGLRDGVGPDSRILLWGGGLWDWLDPLTLVRAMPHILAKHPEARLVFPGTRHPNQVVPDMRMRSDAVALADSMGLRDRHVIFGDWVPYSERARYLLESDIGVSLHFDHVETRMAFRTRILDYIWAGLPMVVSQGDVMSDWVREWQLGEVVPFEDPPAVAEAVCTLLDFQDLRARFAPAFLRAAAALQWEQVAKPLVEFCAQPRMAADRQASTLPDCPGAVAARQEHKGAGRESSRLTGELERLRLLVAAYERGRFVRFMRWLRTRK